MSRAIVVQHSPEKCKLFTLMNQIKQASKHGKVNFRHFSTPPTFLFQYDPTDQRKLLKMTYNIVDGMLSIKTSTHHPDATTRSFYPELNKMLTMMFADISDLHMNYHENGVEATITCSLKNTKKQLSINQVLGVSLASSYFLAHKTIREAVFKPLLESFCALNAPKPEADKPPLVAVAIASIVPEGAILPSDTIMVEAFYEIPPQPVVSAQGDGGIMPIVVVASAKTTKTIKQSVGIEGVFPKVDKFQTKLVKAKATLDYFPRDSTVMQCLKIFRRQFQELKPDTPKLKRDTQEIKDLIKMFLLQINDIWIKNNTGIETTLPNMDKIKLAMLSTNTLLDALQTTLLPEDRTYKLVPAHISQLIDPFFDFVLKERVALAAVESAAGGGGGGN